jgi:hypothetical protein
MPALGLARKAVHCAATLGLFLHAAASAAPESTSARPSARYKALAKIIDRNVGHAHMTRGVNACTILALRDQVTDQDIEVLAQLLESNDSVHRLASGYVLSVLGPVAVSTLQTRGTRLGPGVTADLVADSENTRQTLASYRASQGCEPATTRPQSR